MAATTRSSIQRLLRAATSHRNSITPCLTHHNTSPSSYLNSQYPSNHRFFSSRSWRVNTRATAFQNPKTPRSIWTYALTFGCIAATGLSFFYKFQQKAVGDFKSSLNAKGEVRELRVEGSYPNLFREGHSVVVELLMKWVKDEYGSSGEYYFSATEVVLAVPRITAAMIKRNEVIITDKYYFSATQVVLAMPQEITAAMKRNKRIIEDKLKLAEEEDEQDYWNTTSRYGPWKSIPEAVPSRIKLEVTKVLKDALLRSRGLPDLLQEGDSVFVKASVKPITDKNKDDKSHEIYKFYQVMQNKLEEIKEDKSAKRMTFKNRDTECHFSVEVLAKHDEKHMPQESAAVYIEE